MKARILVVGLLAGLGLSSTACDLVVSAGETITAGNRGQVLGSPGDAEKSGNVAVTLRPHGSFVLDGADVFGGDDSVEKQRGGSSGPFTEAGDGIRSDRGLVTIQPGSSVQGGDARAVDGTAFAGNGITLSRAGLLLNGGQIRAGRASGGDNQRSSPGVAILASSSTVELAEGSAIVEDALVLFGSNLTVSGGFVEDDLLLRVSTAIIRGGSVGKMVVFPESAGRSCVEILGGRVDGPISLSQSDLFIGGKEFNRPFGEVTEAGPIGIVGRLADDSEIALFVFRGPDARVFLVERDSLPRPRFGGLNCMPVPLPAS